MALARLVKHLFTTRRHMKRRFPAQCLEAIESAIRSAEAGHLGEICFAVEAALPPAQVLRGVTPHEHALDVFAQERVWDTEHNSGVLIYVLLADHAIEIIADRGIHAKSGTDQVWHRIVGAMQSAFAAGHFETGAVQGIAAVAAELTRHFPASGPNANELPDQATLL